MSAFFITEDVSITRTLQLCDYQGRGDTILIGIDASPYGTGGWIGINGKVMEYFSDTIQANDEAILQVKPGQHESKQTLQFLAILIALRLWVDQSSNFSSKRIQLTIRGDNIGALSLTQKLRPKGPTMAIIAREVALILASLSFPPKVDHTPGVAHILDDALSIVTQKDGSIFTTHPASYGVVRRTPAERNRTGTKHSMHISSDPIFP